MSTIKPGDVNTNEAFGCRPGSLRYEGNRDFVFFFGYDPARIGGDWSAKLPQCADDPAPVIVETKKKHRPAPR